MEAEHGIAALLQVKDEIERLDPKPAMHGKVYKREGMMNRVLGEDEHYPISIPDPAIRVLFRKS